MPPRWPPIPRAHVLQAFLLRIARQSFKKPPASRAFRHVYQAAGQPPPDFNFLICFFLKYTRRDVCSFAGLFATLCLA
jgi:hypothetical protein